MTSAAVIFGCAGLRLTDSERRLFRDADPLGFILFARNCDTPDQVRALVESLRDAVGRADAPVLIDQEGGRVARLRPPHWRAAPPPAVFGTLAGGNRAAALEAVRLNARLLADELLDLGITVDCAPLLDLRMPGTHEVIGDRSFGETPDLVAMLGRAACEGFLAGGVMPVVKHVPGHGRAMVDSHHHLPVVDTPLDELRETDFRTFRALNDMPWAMTAHVVFSAVDPERPATTSPAVVTEVIRGDIGFQGFLVSDDLSMKALAGDFAERTRAALAAGCDVVLHCNGDMAEMQAVATAVAPLSSAATARLAAGAARLEQPEPLVMAEAVDRLDHLLRA
ncbi:beta-N-acetylhexosaminidase [Rhodospirillaceae bacterium SYSU D60014]|uniref:beta-N-acetylhexosaminidase n=1 Tax=Virgifigura deserti TaxID=2268457 RepID=UPI000E676682